VLLERAIDDFAVYLTAERGFSAHTVRSYRSDLADFERFAEGKGIATADGVDLELLRDWLWDATKRGLAKSTLARRSAAVRSWSSWLSQTGAVTTDAAARLRAPKADHHLPRVLTRQQMDGLLAGLTELAATGDAVASRDLAIVELLYASALRVSEIVGLDLADIDHGRLTVRVTGKGSKERVVPFGLPAGRAIINYENRRHELLAEPTPAVFLGVRGKRIGTRTVYELIAGLLESVPGSGPSGPHTLRHTAATHLLDGAGIARPREPRHDPAIHACFVGAPQGCVQDGASSGLKALPVGRLKAARLHGNAMLARLVGFPFPR
jgi:integrase/recombinase XerC